MPKNALIGELSATFALCSTCFKKKKLSKLEEIATPEMIQMRDETIAICKRVLEQPGKLRADYVDYARATLVSIVVS